MKKLILSLILFPMMVSAQCNFTTLINVYPLNATPTSYQAQPPCSVNNCTTQSVYGDSLTAVIKLQWQPTCSFTATTFQLLINNIYAGCNFAYTPIRSISYSSLTLIAITGVNQGYYKFNFKLAPFSVCSNSIGATAYNLKMSGNPDTGLQPYIGFTVIQATSAGVEELIVNNKVVKTEFYNILGQPSKEGDIIIKVEYFENGVFRRTKIISQ